MGLFTKADELKTKNMASENSQIKTTMFIMVDGIMMLSKVMGGLIMPMVTIMKEDGIKILKMVSERLSPQMERFTKVSERPDLNMDSGDSCSRMEKVMKVSRKMD